MNTRPASLELQSRPAQVQVSRSDAQADIQSAPGTLTIDTSGCRAARGFRSPSEMAGYVAQQGLQGVQNAVSEYVQIGNRLAQISNPGNSVVQICTDRNTSQLQPLSITWAAVPLPEIHYEPSPLRIDWSAGQLRYQVQPSEVTGSYSSGEVDIQVAQYADLDIQAIDSGSRVNRFI